MVDPEAQKLAAVIRTFLQRERENPESFFGRIIRQGLDEVIDGPRTKRWSASQLEKTEKTYVGTKMEILTRLELEAEEGTGVDCRLDGIEFDIKWSIKGAWMIAPENVGRICLGLETNRAVDRYSVGVFRAEASRLSPGLNRDDKARLSAQAKRTIVEWLVENEPLAPVFLARLDPAVRNAIFKGENAQTRIKLLATLVQGMPIPRAAFETVAGNKRDPMRRLRQDKYRTSPLGDVTLLSTKYKRSLLRALGYTALPADHWIAVPTASLKGISK